MRSLFFYIFMFGLFFVPYSTKASQIYTIARAPQLSSVTLSKSWTPFVNYLSNVTGYKFKLKLYQGRTDFESDLKKGNVDLFFANPGYFSVAHYMHGYLALVRSGAKQLKGIVVVRNNSGIDSIEQLQGKSIAFPGKNAFAASLYIRSILNKKIKFKTQYIAGHDNVYRSVAAGAAIAGGGVYRTLNGESVNLKSRLKVIYETPGIAPHPLAAHPDVPKKTQESIIKAVLDLHNSKEGREMLKAVKMSKPSRTSYMKDYQLLGPIASEMYHHIIH